MFIDGIWPSRIYPSENSKHRRFWRQARGKKEVLHHIAEFGQHNEKTSTIYVSIKLSYTTFKSSAHIITKVAKTTLCKEERGIGTVLGVKK